MFHDRETIALNWTLGLIDWISDTWKYRGEWKEWNDESKLTVRSKRKDGIHCFVRTVRSRDKQTRATRNFSLCLSHQLCISFFLMIASSCLIRSEQHLHSSDIHCEQCLHRIGQQKTHNNWRMWMSDREKFRVSNCLPSLNLITIQ